MAHFVIMGCGRVGATLAHTLEDSGHSVAIIDQDERAFRRLRTGFGGRKITGVGFDQDTLKQADIENAYAFAAVSSGDNSNILATRVARETFHVEHVVARIYDPGRAEIYQRLGIPALEAAFFGERKVPGETRALLLTRALDGWDDLDSLLQRWAELSAVQHRAILQACGVLARQLHGLRQIHGCFYPKHIFLQASGDGYQAQLIDLEKTRPLLFGVRDRVKDLEPLLRRTAPVWNAADVRILLAAYLDQPTDSTLVDAWLVRLGARSSHKEAR